MQSKVCCAILLLIVAVVNADNVCKLSGGLGGLAGCDGSAICKQLGVALDGRTGCSCNNPNFPQTPNDCACDGTGSLSLSNLTKADNLCTGVNGVNLCDSACRLIEDKDGGECYDSGDNTGKKVCRCSATDYLPAVSVLVTFANTALNILASILNTILGPLGVALLTPLCNLLSGLGGLLGGK